MKTYHRRICSIRVAVPAALMVLALTTAAGAQCPIYVAAGGHDDNVGTKLAPKRTIQAALAAATPTRAPVYVAEGVYTESLTLPSHAYVLGGFDPALDWARDPTAHPTVISGGAIAVTAIGVEDVILDGLSIWAADGASSYALWLDGCNLVRITGCQIRAGRGAAGASGTSGAPAASSGHSGYNGQPGCESSSGFCSTCPRPIGGPGQNVGGSGGAGGLPGGGGGQSGFAGGFGGPARVCVDAAAGVFAGAGQDP